MPLLPPENLAYPVRISIGGSVGSGFYYNTETSIFLVTAKHVLFKNGLELYSSKATLNSRDAKSNPIELVVDCEALQSSGDLKKHDTADVTVIKIGSFVDQAQDGPRSISFGPDVEVSKGRGGVILGLPADATHKFDQVGISNRTILTAFPGKSLGTTGQIDHSHPLLRQGIVAGKTDDRRIVLDCPSYFGNSGGFVLEIIEEAGQRWIKGIGLISQQVPFVEELWSKQFKVKTSVRYENSGYSIVEPMDRVQELVALFDVPPALFDAPPAAPV
jgi:hypothetical protein